MDKNNELTFAEQAFAGFESQEVNFLPFEQLPEGWHPVTIKMAIITTDFMKGLRNPTPKPVEERPVWKDATVQIAVYFEAENHTGATRRFSRFGYWKYDDFIAAHPDRANQVTKEGDQGYAVLKDKGVRIQSEDATNAAGMILNRMLTAAGIPAGTKGSDLCKALEGKKLKIQVTKHVYNKEEYFDVANFVSIETPDSELERVPQPKAREEAVVSVPETA